MCNTPYCFGDCEECEKENVQDDEYCEQSDYIVKEKECELKAVSDKVDYCNKCGYKYVYS